MLKIINEVDFNILYCNAWGQAIAVLKEIQNAGMENELMGYLEDIFNEGVDMTELNDLLSYDWEWVYSQIGMPSDVTERLAAEENEEVE